MGTRQTKITEWPTGSLKRPGRVRVQHSKAFRRHGGFSRRGVDDVKPPKGAIRIKSYWRKLRRPSGTR